MNNSVINKNFTKSLKTKTTSLDGIVVLMVSQELSMKMETTCKHTKEKSQKFSKVMPPTTTKFHSINSPETSSTTTLLKVLTKAKISHYQSKPVTSILPKMQEESSLPKPSAPISANVVTKEKLTSMTNMTQPGHTSMSTVMEDLMPLVCLPNSWDSSVNHSDGSISSDHLDSPHE